MEFLNVPRSEPEAGQTRAFGRAIVDADCKMTVSIAVAIGLRPALVQGQFDFEVVLVVAQVNQREIVEIVSVGDRKAERLAVERDRFFDIEHPDHGMNCLGHFVGPFYRDFPLPLPVAKARDRSARYAAL